MKNATPISCTLLLTCLQVACAANSQLLTANAVEAPVKAIPVKTMPESDWCPSQDFPTFLKRFSDANDASIRARFTADPVAYEVLFYTVAEPDETSPEMFVSEEKGVNRLNYYPYRYFASADDYDRTDDDGQPYGLPAVHSGKKYPLQIVKTSGDGRRVVFGMEYEIDVFEFERAEGCWNLNRIINPRD